MSSKRRTNPIWPTYQMLDRGEVNGKRIPNFRNTIKEEPKQTMARVYIDDKERRI